MKQGYNAGHTGKRAKIDDGECNRHTSFPLKEFKAQFADQKAKMSC